MMYRLGPESIFPSPDMATPTGLLAWGGDLGVERLVSAYSQGIFPWYGENTPILWWSPDPRCALPLGEFHMPRSLSKMLKKSPFTFTLNHSFSTVISQCAIVPRPGQNGTWLVPEMIEAYTNLHNAGYAHSLEVWQNGSLVGGLYGVALGHAFFGESMFHLVPNASKAAFACLVHLLLQQNFTLIDCQQTTPHMLRFGAREMPRAHFLSLLHRALA